MDSKVKISIIIPNLNSPIINETIDSILNQKSPYKFEIIVVGQDKYGIVQRYGGKVTFIQTDKPVNAAIARNIGISRGTGDYYLFVDSDCVPDPDWIEVMISSLENNWDVVGGGVRIENQDYLSLIYNLSMFHEFLWKQKERKVSYLPTLNIGVKRSVINKIGCLNENLSRAQDLDWTMRMTNEGVKVLFLPKATIVHKPIIKNFKIIRRQFYSSGFFSIQIRQRYQEQFSCFILRKAWFWSLFSPLIALLVTVNLILRTPFVWLFFYTFPAIYLSKVEWCLGAARGIKNGS